MGKKVKNLTINLQNDGGSTHYATWDFDIPPATDSSAGIQVGDLVKIKSGATYYNGTAISDWVFPLEWYVSQLKGSRAVLGADSNGLFNIVSPIDVKYLTKVSGSDEATTNVNTLDHYEVKWYYDSGNYTWFTGSSSNVDANEPRSATYSAPDNAIAIKVSVKPVAKTKKVNNNETEYWTGTSVVASYNTSINPPEVPSGLKVEVDKYTLTASIIDVTDPRTDRIQFQIYDGTSVFAQGESSVTATQAFYSYELKAGGEYRVRCRSVNLNSTNNVFSDWTDFVGPYTTVPDAITAITKCEATSETSVYLEWEAAPTATSYEIQYAKDKTKFDNSDEPVSKSGIEFNHFEVTGLETGSEYFFRIRAVNEKGESAWTTDFAYVTVGTVPEAPTTWSSTSTAVTTEPLTFYWVHNCEDGSAPTYAYIEMTINGIEQPIILINYADVPEEPPNDLLGPTTVDTNVFKEPAIIERNENTTSLEVSTAEFDEGATIEWRVATAGVTLEAGDKSVKRTVKIYAPPTLSLSAPSSVSSFPINVSALGGPNTQRPIGYHLTITSNETYETVDNIGNPKIVSAGETIYSRYFDINTKLETRLTPADVDFEDDRSYTMTCVVSMDSGLTAENSQTFTVNWTEAVSEPDAMLTIDLDNFVVHIRPTTTSSGVTLAVYRREYDGSFTLIADGLDGNTYVTDPHPALDFARYRIVATSTSTGAISYYDIPGYPMGGKAVIIQWDEVWSKFDVWSEDEFEQPVWGGSMLRLPYNIDVSEGNDIEVSFVNYIGREHPVSYYGTHVGETATWSVAVPKADKDTIYALRRLSKWKGDVYVREPSGVGYWAHIKVSFSQKHNDLVVPVSMDITRVEGGM